MTQVNGGLLPLYGPLGNAAGGTVVPPAAGTWRQPLTGLLARQVADVQGRAADLGGVCASLDWATLQPAPGPLDLNGTPGTAWEQMVLAEATGLGIKARLYTGALAPDWVKALGGGPLTVTEPFSGKTSTVPRWWHPDVISAYADLQVRFAAAVAGIPQVREVATHDAGTVFQEPCIRSTQVAANVQAYYGAGLTGVAVAGGKVTGPDPLDGAALTFPWDPVGGVTRWETWQGPTGARPRFNVPFNPLQQWQVTATSPFTYTAVTDPGGFTGTMIAGAAALGPGVVLGNNSLRVPLAQAGAKYPGIVYGPITAAPCATYYQTATLTRLQAAYATVVPGCTATEALRATLDVAFGVITAAADPHGLLSGLTGLSARSVEVPTGWHTLLTPAECATWNARAAQNPTGY